MWRNLGLCLALVIVGSLIACASAKFEVSQLSVTPSKVFVGDNYTVQAKVSNVGNKVGAYTAVLMINGIERSKKDIAIVAGGTEEVGFTLTEEAPGNYAIVLADKSVVLEVVKVPTAQEIVSQVLKSIYSVETYQFDVDMVINIRGEENQKPFDSNTRTSISGVVDELNRRARMEWTDSSETSSEEPSETNMELYLIGNTMYFFVQSSDTEPEWYKMTMPIGSWKTMTQVESQKSLLESATVEFIGNDEVRGEECYVLKVNPDLEQLWKITMQQSDIVGNGWSDIEDSLIRELFRSIFMKQWINKNTHMISKAEISMSIDISPKVARSLDFTGSATMDIAVNSFIYNYNKPFAVSLPLGAENAVSLDGSNESEAAATELSNIQSAVVSMMVDQGLYLLPAGDYATAATNDMSRFPDPSINATRHVLFGYGGSPDINYLTARYTMGTYTCDANGTVTQVTTGY